MKINKRNYGIDLLKIIAMIGIIMLHINGVGGALTSKELTPDYYLTGFFGEIFFFCSINIFAMISGYLMYKKEKFNSYRAFELIITVATYMILLSIIWYLIYPESYNGFKSLIKDNLFLLDSTYWYIVNYLPILILSPFINKFISSLNKKQFSSLCIILFVMFSLIPSVLNYDLFILKNGYSFLWLFICYIFGAYIRSLNLSIKNKTKYAILFLVNCIIVLAIKYVLFFKMDKMSSNYLFTYISPFIVTNSIISILLFKDIKINEKANNIISLFSSVTFDVYIVHCHFLFFRYLLANRFSFVLNYSPLLMPIIVLGSAILLFIAFAIIGIIRIKLFDLIKLEKIFNKITHNKLSYNINDIS